MRISDWSSDVCSSDLERSVFDARGEIVQPYTDHSQKSFALPAQTREYNVEFWPIGNRFQAGHRLRLYLLGAATYSIPAPNLNLVSVGGDTPSRLLLPVLPGRDRKSTRLNSSHYCASRMPSSA